PSQGREKLPHGMVLFSALSLSQVLDIDEAGIDFIVRQ
ncbi:hypothetical protein AVEN_120045-1, partial [Araneus ventricosus]